MIAYITGKILDLSTNNVTILTQSGIGYEIFINEVTFSQIVNLEETELYVYHHITENMQSLFGFSKQSEKQVFTQLLKISGVGGKVALQVLGLGIENLVQAIKNEDNKTIESIKGIGKKMAEKIILELRDKDFGIEITQQKTQTTCIEKSLEQSIQTTLVNMGYQAKDITEVLQNLPENMTDAGSIIPYVIKHLS